MNVQDQNPTEARLDALFRAQKEKENADPSTEIWHQKAIAYIRKHGAFLRSNFPDSCTDHFNFLKSNSTPETEFIDLEYFADDGPYKVSNEHIFELLTKEVGLDE